MFLGKNSYDTIYAGVSLKKLRYVKAKVVKGSVSSTVALRRTILQKRR